MKQAIKHLHKLYKNKPPKANKTLKWQDGRKAFNYLISSGVSTNSSFAQRMA